jgi:hypothetical protein
MAARWKYFLPFVMLSFMLLSACDGPISEAETNRQRYPDSTNPKVADPGATYSEKPSLPDLSPAAKLEREWKKAYAAFVAAQKEWGRYDSRTEELWRQYKKLDAQRNELMRSVHAAR